MAVVAPRTFWNPCESFPEGWEAESGGRRVVLKTPLWPQPKTLRKRVVFEEGSDHRGRHRSGLGTIGVDRGVV